MLRFSSGARGILRCSEVAPGNENALRLRAYDEKGGLEWAQEDPNYLWHTPFDEAKRLITRNGAVANEAGMRLSRIPPGYPEGFRRGLRIFIPRLPMRSLPGVITVRRHLM